MPLTFIDIEKQKNWRIGAFFLVLMLLYFCIACRLRVCLPPYPVRCSAPVLGLPGDDRGAHRRHPFLVLGL